MAEKDKEKVLWVWLKKSLPQLGVPHDVQRIENSVGLGTPDVEGCIDGRSFWIELKVATELTTRPEIRVRTTAHQVYFALKRTRAGGRSWYLIRAGKAPHFRHYLVHGQDAEALLDRPIPLDWLALHARVDPHVDAKALLLAASQA